MSDCPQPKWPSFFAQFLGSSGPLHGFFLPGTKLERRPKLSSMIFGVRCTGNRHLTHLPMKGWNLKINPPPKEETSWIIGQTPIEKGGFQLFRLCFGGKTLYPEHSGIFPKDPNQHWNFLQDFLARLQMLVPPKKHLQTWRFSPPQKIDNQKVFLKQNPWRSQKQKLLGISSIFGTFFCFIVSCLRFATLQVRLAEGSLQRDKQQLLDIRFWLRRRSGEEQHIHLSLIEKSNQTIY